jgi:hypothetical protein
MLQCSFSGEKDKQVIDLLGEKFVGAVNEFVIGSL